MSWVHPLEGDWRAPVEQWVAGSGCDAMLLRYAVHEPLDYAAAWNRPYRTNPELYGAAIARWAAYFEEIGVEAISWGALILRRRDGDNWFFPYSSTTDRITGASEQVLRLCAAQDYLAATTDEQLAEAVLELVPEHHVEQSLRLGGGGALVERNVLRLDQGLRFEVSIDQSTERLLSLLDGERKLERLLEEATDTVPDVTVEAFAGMALPVVRRLIELGFVVPAADALC